MSFPLQSIDRPTLLLNTAICKENIQFMADKARDLDLRFRPHFKTHQSAEIAQWFHEAGIRSITVSSLDMATYFAGHGWTNITLAFPVHPRLFPRIQALGEQCELQLLVDQEATAQALLTFGQITAGIWIKIDTDGTRAGIPVKDSSQIDSIISLIGQAPHLQWKGFLAHAGQTYDCRTTAEIQSQHDSHLATMNQLAQRYLGDHPQLEISVGDTPSCTAMNHFPGVNEIRPGVFVFYDLMQEQVGVCTHEQQALAMACPVVSVYPDRQEVLVHGGAIHFSKEALVDNNDQKYYGKVVAFTADGWSRPLENVVLKKISQEHGLITGPSDWVNAQKPGNLLGVMPVHACLTANLMKRFFTENGEEIRQMPVF